MNEDIAKRYLAGETIHGLARELSIPPSTLGGWFVRHGIRKRLRYYQEAHRRGLTRYERLALSPCAKAIAEAEASGVRGVADLAKATRYTVGTIKVIRSAMRHMKRKQNAALS